MSENIANIPCSMTGMSEDKCSPNSYRLKIKSVGAIENEWTN